LPVLGDRRPLVSVICVSNRPERLEHALENYRRQTYRPVELIFVMNSSRFDRNEVAARVAELPKARCLYVDEAATLADCLNEALTLADGEYFAKFDDDDHYGDDYLNDLMLPFDYSDAAIVGKRTTFMHLEGSDVTLLRNPGREFTFVPVVAGATLVVDRRATAGIHFSPVVQGTDTLFLTACTDAGLKIFSADRFNFVMTRNADLSRHTWPVEEEHLIGSSQFIGPGLALQAAFV
jgi:cellulose synthase/poly-beta-1,6-N-acetylglucosamine synthase-like glycosyltransferase